MCLCGIRSYTARLKSVESQPVKDRIDDMLKQTFLYGDGLCNERYFHRAWKVLLLGSSGCGKSTVIKKLRMRFGRNISSSEKEETRLTIFTHIYSILACSIRQLQTQGRLLNNTDDGAIEKFWSLNPEFDSIHLPWNDELLSAMRNLCRRAIVNATALRFIDKGSYIKTLFASYDQILRPDWIPTEADVIQSYVPTETLSATWISKDVIVLEINTRHTTQKEMSHIMPLIDGIVCAVDISCLNCPCPTYPASDQLKESLDLLEDVMGRHGMREKSTQLLLNKTDIRDRKLKDLASSMPSENVIMQRGTANSVIKCFVERLGCRDKYYSRHICALNATWMEDILQVWREMMFDAKLRAASII